MQEDGISTHRSKLDVGGMHWKRAYRMLTFVNFLAMGLGIAWGVYAVVHLNMLITRLAVIALIMAALIFRLIAAGKVKLASYKFILIVFFILCLTSTYLSILHQFFLPLALCSFLLMRNEIAPMKHGIPLLCLTAFGWFSCIPSNLTSHYALPPNIRELATWFNQIFAGLTAYVCMHLSYEDVIEQGPLQPDSTSATSSMDTYIDLISKRLDRRLQKSHKNV